MLHLCCHLFRSKQRRAAGGERERRSSSYSKAEGLRCRKHLAQVSPGEGRMRREWASTALVQDSAPFSPTPTPGWDGTPTSCVPLGLYTQHRSD